MKPGLLPRIGARARPLLIPAACGLGFLLLVLLFAPVRGFMGWVLALAGGATVSTVAAAVPTMLESRRGTRIDDDLPFFITHFGVLSTSNLPRAELLHLLSSNQEYPEIAAEVARMHRLTSDWGLGLSDAVRAVAQSTPSKTFSAFLLRLAHSLEAGQPLESFLMSEQRVVMDEYKSLYHADLLRVESWKEVYTNSLMTVGFLSIFAAILPLFTGGNTLVFTVAIAFLTLLLELLLGVVLQGRLPKDQLSPTRPIRTRFERQLQRLLLAMAGVSALLGVAAWFLWGLGGALLVAAVPMLVPGVYATREEAAIRRRENDYPAFIRSLGAAAAARGGAIRGVLGNLQANNLGDLTEPVRHLHRRLMWRVDDRRSWRSFGEQTESRLIDSFSDMFVQGIAAGGKPGPISHVISQNMLDVLALRTSRRATAGTFRGLLMGLGVGLAAVLFMGSGILAKLTTTFSGSGGVLVQQGLFNVVPPTDIGLSQQVLLALVAAHGVAAGIFFELVQGGRIEGAALHAAVNLATGVATAMLILWGLPRIGFL
jgi:flagellar protein FlaJ